MKLVIGASGFVGSHVTRQLVEGGEDVRVMLRKTSSTKGIDDLAARLLKRNLMFAAVGLRIATTMTRWTTARPNESSAGNPGRSRS